MSLGSIWNSLTTGYSAYRMAGVTTTINVGLGAQSVFFVFGGNNGVAVDIFGLYIMLNLGNVDFCFFIFLNLSILAPCGSCQNGIPDPLLGCQCLCNPGHGGPGCACKCCWDSFEDHSF